MHRILSFNITQKFLAFLLFASIIPLLAVGISSYTVSSRLIKEEASRSAESLASYQKDNLDLQLEQVDGLLTNLANAQEIIAVLDQSGPVEPYTRLATTERMGSILSSYNHLDGLVSVDLFSLTGAHYHLGDTLAGTEIRTEVKERIFIAAAQGQGKAVWLGIDDNVNAGSRDKKVISAARTLIATNPDNKLTRTVGFAVVNLSVDALYNSIQRAYTDNTDLLMIIDGQSRILYHPDRSLLGAKVSVPFASSLDGPSGSFSTRAGRVRSLVFYRRSEISGWKVVSTVPLNSVLSHTQTIGLTNIGAITLSFLMILMAAWMVSDNLVAPLRQLTQRFQLFQAGKLDPLEPMNPTSKDEVGELVLWFNAFQESLRAKRHAEEALRESEERYSLAIRGANDGVWDWDLRSNRIHYSPRWKAILGYPEGGLNDTPEEWFNRVHPDDYAQFKANLTAHINDMTPYFQSEHRLRMAGGMSYRWVLARGLAVRDEDGRALRMAGSLTDITERKETEERLRHDAMHDNLTNLPNRAYFMDQLRRCIDRAARHSKYRAAVLFLDLDRFKIVNDSLGHEAGDVMLITIAQRLTSCMRASDSIARFGGDEFALLLDDIQSLDEAIQVAGRIQHKLSAPILLEGREIFSTASIGLAMVRQGSGQAEDIMRDADTAMYQAKSRGRDCHVIYGSEMHAKNLALLQLEAQLRGAVERQDFVLHYQPIVSMESGRPVAFEALVRWLKPDGVLVPPGDFIGLAEETGLIVPIGEWVLRTACAQIKAWRQAGWPELSVAVNISARQLQDQRLPALVGELLDEHGLPGEALRLEITETDAMVDLDLTVQILHSLSSMNVQAVIDDFGNSYSSLGYLKRFPVKSIKIDRSFVRDLNINHDVAAITTAIIAMAHILDLEVVAEGVEDEQQRDFLREQGCDWAQGNLFSPAIPANEVTSVLEQETAA